MIVFDLKCAQDHQFESWFRSSGDYEQQQSAGLVECPYCGSVDIAKAPMAPNVGAKGNQKHQIASTTPGQAPTVNSAMARSPELQKLVENAADAMAKLQQHVEENCENVGENFAEEARKIHYGESKQRGIYGESSIDEAQELQEEGIDVMPLPGVRRNDA